MNKEERNSIYDYPVNDMEESRSNRVIDGEYDFDRTMPSIDLGSASHIVNHEIFSDDDRKGINREDREKEKRKQKSSSGKQKKSTVKVKSKKKKIIITTIISLFALGMSSGLFLLYGPWGGFREWLITTAMTTLNHQYFATWFYSDKTIQEVLNKNVVIESGENTNPNLVQVGQINFNVSSYANKYEKEILTKDPGNDLYKMINITGKGYKGYLIAVYDPSRISVISSANVGVSGQYLTTMAKNNKALVAINGGGFVDPNYSSNGGVPQGIVIQNGKVISNRPYRKSGGLIGFTKENKFILGRMTANQALQAGVRDAVTFGPFLIVNGKKSFIRGNGGWGTAPRTAIGQRKDGIVLMLVVDGRTLKYPGADMVDLAEIMYNYGAYNAANLDGGTSSALVINNKLINDPVDGSGRHETRAIATGFMVK